MTAKKTNSIQGFPSKYDESELKKIQEGYHHQYHNTDMCYQLVRGPIPHDLLASVVEHHDLGYRITAKYPVSFDVMSYSCQMLKPLNVQEEDLKVIDERVKQEYIAKLQKELEDYRQKLTQQLIEADEEKEFKRLAAAKAKRLADIEAEVDNVFKSVVIPA